MELKDYFRLLGRRWWLILACVALGVTGAFVATKAQTPVYGSSMTFYLSDAAGRPVNVLVATSAQSRFATYITLTRSDEVVSRVLEAADGAPLLDVTAAGVPDTIFLELSVQSTSAEGAYRLAQAYAEVFPAYITEFEGGGTEAAALRVLEPPALNPTKISPDDRRNLTAGLALGLVLGLLAALVLESLDSRVRSADDIERETGAPVLASVPREHRRERLVLRTKPHSRRAEAVRHIRANIQFAELEREIATILVTSAVAGEGKTSVAADLALALAEGGRRVAIVDGDMRKPVLARVFDVPVEPGLTTVLSEELAVARAVHPWRGGDLLVLPSGGRVSRPAELLGRSTIARMLSDLSEIVDVVVVDSAPLLPVADTTSWIPHVDTVVLVTRVGLTTQREVKLAVDRLKAFQAPLLGVVANGVKGAGGDYYYRGDKTRRMHTVTGNAAVVAQPPEVVDRPAPPAEPHEGRRGQRAPGPDQRRGGAHRA